MQHPIDYRRGGYYRDAVILARLPPGAPLSDDPLAILREADPLVGPVVEVRV